MQENLAPECKQFLFMGTLPRGLEDQPFKKICQFYKGNPRYVTLYDTFNHIPVYSAYTFKRSDGSKKADAPWMYEPQVGMRCCFTVFTSQDLEKLNLKCLGFERVEKSRPSNLIIYSLYKCFVFSNDNVYPDSSPQSLDHARCSSCLLKMFIKVLRMLRLCLRTTLTV